MMYLFLQKILLLYECILLMIDRVHPQVVLYMPFLLKSVFRIQKKMDEQRLQENAIDLWAVY